MSPAGYPEQVPAAGLHGYVRAGGARAGAARAQPRAPVHAGRRRAPQGVRAEHHRRDQGYVATATGNIIIIISATRCPLLDIGLSQTHYS